MKFQDMNATQKLVSLITGYDTDESSAPDEGYGKQKTAPDKINYIREVSENHDDIPLNASIIQAYNFIETDFENSNEKYHSFINLIQL